MELRNDIVSDVVDSMKVDDDIPEASRSWHLEMQVEMLECATKVYVSLKIKSLR